MKRRRPRKILWTDADAFPRGMMDELTIADAKDYHREQFKLGEIKTCLCCGQTVKAYARRINEEMVRALVTFARKGALTGREVSQINNLRGGDYAKLLDWGLIRRIEMDNERDKFGITRLGYEFLMGHARVPKYAATYNAKVWGWSSETVSVSDCVEGFSLAEILDPSNIYVAEDDEHDYDEEVGP